MMYSSPAWPNVHLMQWTAEHIGGAPHSLDEDLESVTIKTRKTKACEEKCIIKQHLRWFERCLLFLDDWMSDWFSRKKNRKERNGHVTHGSFCLAARPDPEEPLLFSLPTSKARIPAQPSFKLLQEHETAFELYHDKNRRRITHLGLVVQVVLTFSGTLADLVSWRSLKGGFFLWAFQLTIWISISGRLVILPSRG